MEYKVIALSVGGLGNKVFKHGDIVTELNFETNTAQKLVDGGFLEPIETTEITIETYSVKELKSMLDEKGIEYSKTATKIELFELLNKVD